VQKLLLTVEEVADVTGLGRTMIYQLIRDNHIQSVKVGSARRIPADALARFVESLRGDPEAVGSAEEVPS
jgi:excisionase family DNA binding protein